MIINQDINFIPWLLWKSTFLNSFLRRKIILPVSLILKDIGVHFYNNLSKIIKTKLGKIIKDQLSKIINNQLSKILKIHKTIKIQFKIRTTLKLPEIRVFITLKKVLILSINLIYKVHPGYNTLTYNKNQVIKNKKFKINISLLIKDKYRRKLINQINHQKLIQNLIRNKIKFILKVIFVHVLTSPCIVIGSKL